MNENLVLISELQRDFLLRNYHLSVCGCLYARANTIVVKDMGVENDMGEHPVYVLTPDCKVQSMETYFKDVYVTVQTIIL